MTNTSFQRILAKPKSTFFLFGPRGTGKSTWLKNQFPLALRIDLLRASEYLKFKRDPSLLRAEVMALPRGSWIIVDEIQKLPGLLDEIHALIFDTDKGYDFALSGSSARKLKKQNANMLAGRALSRKFFPLSCLELEAVFDLKQALNFGQLPNVWTLENDAERVDFLDAYVDSYLKEEIQQEALVRGLDTFHRFLGVAAICNAQVLSMSNVARDVGVARSTVQGYFEILSDTLLGWTLPAYRPRAKVKEVAHSKFYFFDCGIVRVLRNETRVQSDNSVLGHLFETFIVNEVRALNSYGSLGAELFYWQAEHGTEVDLILTTPNRRIGFEIKYSDRWEKSYSKGLKSLIETKTIEQGFGIYRGERRMVLDGIEVLPFRQALTSLSDLLR